MKKYRTKESSVEIHAWSLMAFRASAHLSRTHATRNTHNLSSDILYCLRMLQRTTDSIDNTECFEARRPPTIDHLFRRTDTQCTSTTISKKKGCRVFFCTCSTARATKYDGVKVTRPYFTRGFALSSCLCRPTMKAVVVGPTLVSHDVVWMDSIRGPVPVLASGSMGWL